MGECVYVAVHCGRRRRAEWHVVVWSLFLFKQCHLWAIDSDSSSVVVPGRAWDLALPWNISKISWDGWKTSGVHWQVLGAPVYSRCSRSSPARSPTARWWTYWCHGSILPVLEPTFSGRRLTLLRKARSVVFGRKIAGRIVVSVLSLHEQRTGWSSRHRASVEGRRAVYNNNAVPVTSRDWQPPRPLAWVFSHQQHAIFGKWLHHWRSTAARGRRDFRRDFQFVVLNRDNESVGPFSSLSSGLYRYT